MWVAHAAEKQHNEYQLIVVIVKCPSNSYSKDSLIHTQAVREADCAFINQAKPNQVSLIPLLMQNERRNTVIFTTT